MDDHVATIAGMMGRIDIIPWHSNNSFKKIKPRLSTKNYFLGMCPWWIIRAYEDHSNGDKWKKDLFGPKVDQLEEDLIEAALRKFKTMFWSYKRMIPCWGGDHS